MGNIREKFEKILIGKLENPESPRKIPETGIFLKCLIFDIPSCCQNKTRFRQNILRNQNLHQKLKIGQVIGKPVKPEKP